MSLGETDGKKANSIVANYDMAKRKFVWVCNHCIDYVDFESKENLQSHAKDEHADMGMLDYHVLSKDDFDT